MNETVTVDQALSKGRKTVTYPMYAIFIATVILAIVLNNYFLHSDWTLFAGAILGAVICWVYKYYTSPKWTLWAFENVQNVHELERRAKSAQLMMKDSFIEWVLSLPTADALKLAPIVDKFEKRDVYSDDILVPDETVIYYSKGYSLAFVILMAVIAVAGICLVPTRYMWAGLVLIVAGGYQAYKGYKEVKKAMDKTPQIIINASGIQTASIPFHEWAHIKDEQVSEVVTGQGANATVYYFLTYNYPGGFAHFGLEDLTTDSKQLEHLLQTYRTRADKRAKH